MSYEFTIIVPVYNEEDNLIRVEQELGDYLKIATKKTKILFVNDGSKDNTLKILTKIKSNFPNNVVVISSEKNSGKAESVRTGIINCNTNFNFKKIAYLDADLATTLDECLTISKHVNSEIVLAFGSRISKIDNNIDRNIIRHFIGRIIATFISNQLNLAIYDTQCGCKIFEKELSEKIFSEKFISKWLFDVEIFIRVRKHYGLQKAKQILCEKPLKRWIHADGSKLSMKDSIKIMGQLAQIAWVYRNKKYAVKKSVDVKLEVV